MDADKSFVFNLRLSAVLPLGTLDRDLGKLDGTEKL
jgi:hypothetical protein